MNTAVKLKNQYKLVPDSYLNVSHDYDVVAGYSPLHEESRKLSKHLQIQPDPEFSSSHYRLYKGAIKQEEVDFFNEHFETLDKFQLDASVAEIIQKILTPEIDTAIKAYFQSNYAILWYSANSWKSELDPSQYATKWHCDEGPTRHLKTITYLDNTQDHGSSTQIMDLATTQRLKEIGYAYCDIRDRAYDISDLLEQENIVPEQTEVEFTAGDTLLFNPVSLLHKAKQPESGKTRRMFNLCIVPSPLPWEQVIQLGYVPKFNCIPFEGMPAILEKFAGSVNHDDQTNNHVIEVDALYNINDAFTLQHVLELMLGDADYASMIRENIDDGNNITTNIPQLLEILEKILSQGLASTEDPQLATDYRQKLATLKQFETGLLRSAQTYERDLKPNPDAVMWPIPNHPSHPHNKFTMLPYVNKHSFMDMQTPIASAGSCFAFEIAKVLQQQGFNYVISERADDPESGVLVDGYQAGDKYVKFSANFGILFNTPSLLQLAQKAFATRNFNQYLVKLENNLYTDPYRENVFFKSKKAYIEDYPGHIAAIKNTLLNSKAFIFTAGLNECWQMADGTVISRNPKAGFNHLIQHRTLTVAENVEYIKEFYHLVKRHNPDFKLILTLSPVPLLATGRADTHHIIEANTHSKAVLRVALDQVVSELEDAYYLPSYELVTECTESPWTEDHRHVTPDTVNKVVKLFKEMFVKD